MKNSIKALLAGGFATGLISSASARMISIEPSSQTIDQGAPAIYDLVISDLAGMHLAGFAVQINFDSLIAQGVDATYTDKFGNNPLNQLTDVSVPGQLFMLDVADAGVDLSGQGDSFVLGSFTLAGIGVGTTALTIDPSSSLTDAAGQDVAFTTATAALNVTATPDAGASAGLLGLGLLSLGVVRTRFGKA
jgi:hypothetical protein